MLNVIVGLAVLGAVAWGVYKLMNTKEPAPVDTDKPKSEPAAEAPKPAACGCGRSTTGFCVGLHRLSAEEWAVHQDNPALTAKEEPKVEVAAKIPAERPKKPRKVTKDPAAPKKPRKKKGE